jgi:predicted PurR-regulated permease PerM
MLIKLAIIAGIVILGGMIFSAEIENLFPSTANAVDSLKDDVTNLGSKATNSVEKKIDESIDTIVNNTSNTINNEISEAGDKITSEIIEAKESSQKIINEEISNFNPFESIQEFFAAN